MLPLSQCSLGIHSSMLSWGSIKSLEANIVEALRENLELLSEISIQLTDLSLMYDYLIHTENMAS